MFSSAIIWYLYFAGVGSGAFLIAAATMVGHHQKTRHSRAPVPAHTGGQFFEPNSFVDSDFGNPARHRFGIELRHSISSSASHTRITGTLILSAVCIIAASLSLLATFNNPFIAWQVLLTPFVSLTSFGATVVIAFAALATLIAFVSLFELRLPRWLFAILVSLGALAAFCTMLYAGFLLALIVSVDLWLTVFLPLLFVISSVTCGLAASLFFEVLRLGINTPGFSFRWNALLVFGVAEALALAALLVERSGFSPTALASVNLMLSGQNAWPFWFGVVFLGIGLPLIMHLLLPRLPLQALVLIATVGTLIGGFFIRFCIASSGLTTPVFTLT